MLKNHVYICGRIKIDTESTTEMAKEGRKENIKRVREGNREYDRYREW